MTKKIISFLIAAALLLLLAGPASAHYVAIFPADSQQESINVTAEDYYFNINEKTNLYLYVVHPPDSYFTEARENGPNLDIGMNLIAPDGTVQKISVQHAPNNVTYDTGERIVTARWYVGSVTLNQEGVYYVQGYQKGFTDGTMTRERYTFCPLYVGNSSTGWDNVKKYGHDAGSPVTVYATSNPKGLTEASSMSFFVDGDLDWFLNEADDPAPLHNPLPIRAEQYASPAEILKNGPGIGIYEHVNSNMTKSFTFNDDGVWFVIALNQELDEDRDNYQTVYMIPVLPKTPAGDKDNSVPGIGIIGLIACIGIAAGALYMRRK